MALGSESPRKVEITRPPPGWPELLAEPSSPTIVRARSVDEHLIWPQRSGYLQNDLQKTVDFNDPDSVLARGRRLYINCLSCHQGDGRGLYPVYPPLAESEYVLGDPSRLISILLHGIEGPIMVRGLRYQQSMPPVQLGSDEDIAAVLTYVRHAAPILPDAPWSPRSGNRLVEGRDLRAEDLMPRGCPSAFDPFDAVDPRNEQAETSSTDGSSVSFHHVSHLSRSPSATSTVSIIAGLFGGSRILMSGRTPQFRGAMSRSTNLHSSCEPSSLGI